jgi:Rhodopirellula transposase DDE domain
VISVDTKKKELVGNFKNGGRAWRPKDEPEFVDVHAGCPSRACSWMDRKTNRSAPAASAAAIQVVKGDLGDPAPLRAAVEGSTASSR